MSRETAAPVEQPRKLDKEFVGGIAWTAAAKWISQLVSWPSVIIAARFLSQADFGTVDMAGFYYTLTNVLAEFGIGTAVLQLRELEDKVIAQMNTVSLLFGTLATGLSLLVAPLIADFFKAPILTLIIRIASVSFLIVGLQAVPLALMQRAMDYRRLSITEGAQATVQALVTVGGAVTGMGLWSIVIGGMAGRFASLVLTRYWAPCPFARPQWKTILHPMRFGTEIAGQRMAWMFYLQSDAIVVGRLMGPSVLGAYRLAINLATAPTDKIGTLLMRVTGPLFARIQNDIAMTRRYLLILTEVLALALFPLVTGLVVVAPEAVRVLLGQGWDGSVQPLRWLAIFTLIRTMTSLGGQVLTALRFQRFVSWMIGLNVVLMPLAFYIASPRGAGMVAATWVLMSPITNLPSLLKLLHVVECGKRRYLAALLPALIASAMMLAGVIAAKQWLLGGRSPFIQLAVEIPLSGAVYGGVLLLFFRDRILQYARLLLEMRKATDKGITGMSSGA